MKKRILFALGAIIFVLSGCGKNTEIIPLPIGEEIPAEKADIKEAGNHQTEEDESSANTGKVNIAHYEVPEMEEYEYPSEFSMGDNLKTAITELALSYDNFDKDSVDSEVWKEIFAARFIQNTRSSFDYLDMLSEKNDGQISADELNYIQYSLTGIEVDFSSYEGGSVNRYDAASSFNYGSISGYDYEYTDNGVIVTADFEIGYDGTDSIQKRKVTVELVKSPYSCFDGYSVVSLSSEEVSASDG